MRVIQASVAEIDKRSMTPYEFIERVGRTCYKSENLIKSESAIGFVSGLVSRGHTAMTEHFWCHFTFHGNWNTLCTQIEDFVWNGLKDAGDSATFFRFMQVTYLPSKVFLSFPIRWATDLLDKIMEVMTYEEMPVRVPPLIMELLYEVQKAYRWFFKDDCYFVSHQYAPTNTFDIWSESSFLDQLQRTDFSDIEDSYNPDDGTDTCISYKDREIMKHMTHTYVFIVNRGVSHELVRHRPASFAQESTRYCNYSQDKFGNEITVIDPFTALYREGNTDHQKELWRRSMSCAEEMYFALLRSRATAQEARGVLPNDLKTEVVVTANETEWQHIVNLRAKQTTGKAHPQMVEVMKPCYEMLKRASEGRIL